MSAIANTLTVTPTSGPAIDLSTSKIIRIDAKGTGSKIMYEYAPGKTRVIICTDSAATLAASSSTLIVVGKVGGTVYINPKYILEVLNSASGSINSKILMVGENGVQSIFYSTDTKATIQAAIEVVVPDSDATAQAYANSINDSLISFVAGEALTKGDPIYIKSDGKAWKADAVTATKGPAIGLANADIASAGTGQIRVKGIITFGTWTVGGTIYLASGGGLTQTAPPDTGTVVQKMGVAKTAGIIYLNPSLYYTTNA